MSCPGTLSPKFVDVIISKEAFGLNYVIDGYAEGTGITVEPMNDRATPYVGMKGDHSIILSADESYMVTINLTQTSHTNDVLDRLLKLRRQDPLNTTFSIMLRDASGTTELSDSCSYISVEGTLNYSDTIETREWQFILPKPYGQLGGNGRFTVDAQSAFEALGGTVDAKWQAE